MPVANATLLSLTAKPIAWLHVPKSGSSFLNALIRIPGACPFVPEDIVIHDATMGPDNNAGFTDRYPLGLYCPGSFHYSLGSHAGLGGSGASYDLFWKGHGVTMLRNPQQRLLSAFVDNRHSWPASPTVPPPTDPLVFARQVQGCAAKMLVRGGRSYYAETAEPYNWGAAGPHWGGPCGSSRPPSREELEEAKRRLREGFVFVGIVEEWDLSMCLFHRIFGGACHAAELIDSRRMPARRAKPDHDESVLHGFVDKYDAEIYEEGQKIFWEKVKFYGLSEEACQPCYAQVSATEKFVHSVLDAAKPPASPTDS